MNLIGKIYRYKKGTFPEHILIVDHFSFEDNKNPTISYLINYEDLYDKVYEMTFEHLQKDYEEETNDIVKIEFLQEISEYISSLQDELIRIENDIQEWEDYLWQGCNVNKIDYDLIYAKE